MNNCKTILDITYFNKHTKKFDNLPKVINDEVDENQEITIENIIQDILNLDEKSRAEIWEAVQSVKAVQLTSNDIIKGRTFISNIDIEGLKTKFPSISFDLGDLSIDDSFSIVYCNNMKLNNVEYFGRTLDPSGKEIFFINGYSGAFKFAKYLEARTKYKIAFDETSGELKQEYKEFENKLNELKNHFNKTDLLDLVLDFLNNSNQYKIYKNENETINPSRILYSFLNKVTGIYNPINRKSDLRILVEDAWDTTKTDYVYKLSISKLWKILEITQNVKELSKEEFLKLPQEELQKLVQDIFSKDVYLIKSQISKFVQDKDTTIEAHVSETGITSTVKSEYVKLKKQDAYKEKFGKITFDKLTENQLKEVLNILGYSNYTITKSDKSYTIKQKKNVPSQTKPGEKYLIIKFPYKSLGEVYGFDYSTQYMFRPVNEGGVVEGQYNGAYVYSYFDKTSKQTHYAISRHIINPNTYAQTYSTLEDALRKIDYWNKTQSIYQQGLISIRHDAEHRKRSSQLEISGLKRGQIITFHNYNIPRVQFKKLPKEISNLLHESIQNLQEKFNNVSNISKINSPELGSAFILNLYKQWKLQANLNWEQFVNTYNIEQLVEDIVNSEVISYYVESVSTDGIAVLKYLHNNGNEVKVEGILKNSKNDKINMITQPLVTDMDRAIKYYKSTFGIDVHQFKSKSEFESFIKENGIIIDNPDSVRAFVYNGEIYINTYNANIKDLFHEMAHVLIGVMKHKNFEQYQKIIDVYKNQVNKKNKTENRYQKMYKYQKSRYKNLSENDIIEETIAELIASDLYHKQWLVDEFKDTEFEKDLITILKFDQIAQPSTSNSLAFNTIKNSIKDSKQYNIDRMKLQYLINIGKIEENCE